MLLAGWGFRERVRSRRDRWCYQFAISMEQLTIAVKRAEDRRHRANNALFMVEFVTVFDRDSWHLCPMSQRTQVMLLVIAVVERQQVVKRAVVTHGVRITVLGLCAVMLVIVLHVNQSERQIKRRQIAKQKPLPRDRQEKANRKNLAHPV